MAPSVSICVPDDIILPWYFSFMNVMCDLSKNIARAFKLISHSLSPVGTDGGCCMVTSKKSDGLVRLFWRRKAGLYICWLVHWWACLGLIMLVS